MTDLPQGFVYLIGTLIVTNIGAIGSIIWMSFKGVWWLSKLDSRVNEALALSSKEVGAREMSIRAHKRVDKLEAQINT